MEEGYKEKQNRKWERKEGERGKCAGARAFFFYEHGLQTNTNVNCIALKDTEILFRETLRSNGG